MIVITTPTGGIGAQLLDELVGTTDEALRVVVRDPARLPVRVRDRVEVVTGSHGDPAVVDRALDGADALFWLVPPDPRAADLAQAFSGFARPAVDAVARRGVGHVVGVSALGRGTAEQQRAGLVTASLVMDDLFAASGAAFRALACAGFMDNVLRQTSAIRDEGRYQDTVPADRPLPYVATRDIAAVAARLLAARTWGGVDEVPLLGPDDLSADQLTATMSAAIGRPVRYRQQDLADRRAATLAFAGEPFADGIAEMMAAKAEGLDDLAPRAGREQRTPTTFRQWCDEVLAPAVRG